MLFRSANKQHDNDSGQLFKKSIGVLIWSILSLLAASNIMWYFVPPEDFFHYLTNPVEHPVLICFVGIITAFLIYLITLLKENFCIYVCPYVRIQSAMCDEDTLQVLYDEKRGGVIFEDGVKLYSKPPQGDCTGCEACVKVCPTHIDVRKGIQLECIGCLECADACSKVMNKLGKHSLINWISPNALQNSTKTKFVRMKTVGYAVVLSIVFVMLVVMSGHHEAMKLNINRTTELFSIKDDKVENSYTFLFENPDGQAHEYYFEVLNPDISIKRPSEPFVVDANQKVKKVVVLSAPLKTGGNTPIKIRAYAKNKDGVEVFRDTVFVYPQSLK